MDHNFALVVQKLKTRLVPSPMTEALAVVSSLKSASSRQSLDRASTASVHSASEGLPLKLALFNFQKYVKEEDFAVEFMLKGGMKMLLKMLDVREGGLSGNSLAVRPHHFRAFLVSESQEKKGEIPS